MENGKTAVVPKLPGAVCFGSTEFHVVRAEAGIQARWIANYLLQHDTRRAAQRQMTGGVGQMRVPSTFLQALELPVAPTAEQKRIADALDELLSDLDAGVAALESAQTKLGQYRAAVLKAAVEGSLTAEWRKQHPDAEPASELLKRILIERRKRWEQEQQRKYADAGKTLPANWKAKYKPPVEPDTSELPELPRDWCWATVSQVCDFITKGTTPSGALAPTPAGDVPFIKVQHLSSNGSFHFWDTPAFVPTAAISGALLRSRVFPGDILMNIVGPPLGQLAIVPSDYQEWNLNQAIAIFRCVPGTENRYLERCLQSEGIIAYALRRTKTTAGQVNITLKVTREIPFPLPPPAEQQAIVEAVEDQLSVIDHLEADLADKLRAAQGLRQSILRHAFTGKLVPQDPNDEPASELLKRIAAERAERERQLAAEKRKGKDRTGGASAKSQRRKKGK
jgi:type I restriction enzyme S subunit